jgi:hypothetical protein
MTRAQVIAGLAGALLLIAGPVHGQTPPQSPERERGVEVTPYVALGSDGASGFGATIRWPLGNVFGLELETGQRHAERHALTSNLSLVFDLPAMGRVTPYLAAGIGLDQHGYALSTRNGGIVTYARTALSLNGGGGVRVAADEKWGVRSDVRWFSGIGRHAPERWRLYNGVTFGPGKR